MKHGREAAEGVWVPREGGAEAVGLDVIGEAQRREVAPLLVGAEEIGHDDIGVAALVEGPDQGAADEAGAAGDEDASG